MAGEFEPGALRPGNVRPAKIIAQAGVNNTLVFPGPAVFTGLEGHNAAVTSLCIHLYDKVGVPVAGTDVPVMTIRVPAGGRVEIGRSNGAGFASGLGYSITTGFADNDAVAVAAGDFVGSLTYAPGA